MASAEAQKAAVLALREASKSGPSMSMSAIQEMSKRERPSKEPTIVSKTSIAPISAENEWLPTKLWELFRLKSEGTEVLDQPESPVDLRAEWVGVRRASSPPGASQSTPLEQYRCIAENMTLDATIFYAPGGGFMRGGLSHAYPIVQQLCQQSGARAFLSERRIAPQSTYPTILLDVLIGYFSLLAPAPGALHEPVHPSKIVLAGESGGCFLQLALIQFLQFLQRQAKEGLMFRFNGRSVPLAMPAGVALISPCFDANLALPSWERHQGNDYMFGGTPWLKPGFPADHVWPSNPPRGDVMVDPSAKCHPLFCIATNKDWKGVPPVWIGTGEDTQIDGTRFFVRSLQRSGVSVALVEYEFMPHIFPLILYQLPQSRDCMKRWGEACKSLASGKFSRTSSALHVSLGELEAMPRPIESLINMTDEEVLSKMKLAKNVMGNLAWAGPAPTIAKL